MLSPSLMGLYRIRAEMRVNGGERTLTLACAENETPEHLAMKLAAYLSFWDEDMALDPGTKHPALAGQEFRPALLGVDAGGQVAVWGECGNTAMHKLGKVLRRWPDARVALFKDGELKGRNARRDVDKELPDPGRVEVYCWPGTSFRDWAGLLGEKTEVDGEAGGVGFNLVVNGQIYATDLLKL